MPDLPPSRSLHAQLRQLFGYPTQALAELQVGVKEEGNMCRFRLLKVPFLRVARVIGVAAIAVGRMGTRRHRTSPQLLLAASAHPFSNQSPFVLGNGSPNL